VSGELPFAPEPIRPDHEVLSFDCGRRELNEYLSARALADQRADKSRTYVVAHGSRAIAYFTLAAAVVEPRDATERLGKGQGRQPIPVILLARLAVGLSEQGRGLGEALLVDALSRCAVASDVIGARAVLVHAKDQEVRSFYGRYGFESSPTNQLHLVLLMKDIRKNLGL
jgi:GNAT superfamily N-acetyltransferase